MTPRHDANRAMSRHARAPAPAGPQPSARLARRSLLAALAALPWLPAAAQAQQPSAAQTRDAKSDSLTLIVPYAAGGPLDRTARPLVEASTAKLEIGRAHV